MNILTGCEESQTVAIQFRKLGHKAYSNDIIDCSGGYPEWHLKMDIFEALTYKKWDLIIIHPPCTKVCCSGNRTYAKGKPKHNERLESAKWIKAVWNKAVTICDNVCMENPKGVLNGLIKELPRPQYIEPYYFGDAEIKLTGLWLYGLPKLNYTNIVEPEFVEYNSKKTKSGKSKYGKITGCNPSTNNPDNAKLRSKTYLGIAEAMANQWSKHLNNLKNCKRA